MAARRTREAAADAQADVGRHRDALSGFGLALASTPEEATHARARLWRRSGEMQWALGTHREALEAYSEAARLLAGERNGEIATLYCEMARSAVRAGDCARAEGWASTALDIADGLSTAAATSVDAREAAAIRVRARNPLGVCLTRSGQLEAGMKQVEAALREARELDLRDNVCRACVNLGVLYSISDPARAIERSKEGIAVASAIGDTGVQSWLLANLAGAWCAFEGAMSEGLSAAQRALVIDRDLDQRDHLPVSLVVLGQAYECAGEPDEAIRCYLEALALAEDTNEPQVLVPCWEGLGTAYLAKGDMLTAEGYLSKSRALCSAQGLDADSLSALPFLY